MHVNRRLFQKIYYLKIIDEFVAVQLAMSMSSKVMAPGELAPADGTTKKAKKEKKSKDGSKKVKITSGKMKGCC